MKKLLLVLLISSISFAQNANRKYLSHSWKNNILEVKTSDGCYLIKPYSDKIVETSFIPNGDASDNESAKQSFNPNSHAVVKTAEKGWASFNKTDNSLTLLTKGITVVINKSPFKITYSNLGKVLLSEKMGYTKVNDSTETLSFNLDNSEALYGGGARALGMNRRGNRLQLYNRAHYGYETKAELMNFCIPLVMSSKLYAVHFDNAAIGYLDLDSKKAIL
jgi:Alpha-glucosidases, family 31 of glycosyl hydrolases